MITVIHFCKLLNIESTKIESSVIIWWHLALLIQKKKPRVAKKPKKLLAGIFEWCVDGSVSCWDRKRSVFVRWRWKDMQSTCFMYSRVAMLRSQSR